MPKISLVICTHNRADILPRCLAAAARQVLPQSDYEILVVDNVSTDNTAALVQRLISANPASNLRYIYHPHKGLSHARNAGALAARSPIIHYIDDDAVADHNLLTETLRVFEVSPDAGVVGGRIRAVLPKERPPWYSAYFDGYYGELNHRVDSPFRCPDIHHYPYGGNIAYKHEALAAAGYFSPALGRVGNDYAGGEEIDCALRIVDRGYSVYYTPAAIIDHIILPHRVQWAYITGSARSAGRNWAYYDIDLLGNGPQLGTEFRLLGRAARDVLRTLTGADRLGYYVKASQWLFQWSKFKRKCRYVISDLVFPHMKARKSTRILSSERSS